MTGLASTEIGGDTASREFDLNIKTPKAHERIKEFIDTRLIIVDEISFADYEKDLAKMSSHLQQYTECHDFTYGSCAMVFIGDLRQLPPISGNSVYKHKYGIYWEQSLTAMVELKGTHQFSFCPILKGILPTLQEQGMSENARIEFRKTHNKIGGHQI